jgi:hypothetical protein
MSFEALKMRGWKNVKVLRGRPGNVLKIIIRQYVFLFFSRSKHRKYEDFDYY